VNLEKNEFQDPYVDQSSGCLRNLLGIKDSEELSKAETALVVNRCYELECVSLDKTIDKEFDFQHLKDIHKHLFQDVYDWAGQVRHVDLSKGETRFLPYQLIEQGAHSMFSKLKQQSYLKGLDSNEFSKGAGYYLGEINHIHPFREGNGRAQREFINQLAYHNGYYIEWKNVSQRQMIEASIEANKGNAKPLASLIHENLADREIALFIKQNRSFDGGHAKLFSAEAGKNMREQLLALQNATLCKRQ
jgi:cell filamentation protein